MSETIDLQEAMLAELREFGPALAACIVVTPVADLGTHAGCAEGFLDRRVAASPAAAGAGAREETDQIEMRPDLDLHSGLQLAAREAVAEVRAINEACRDGNASSAKVTAMEHVLLTVTGQVDWRQRVQSVNLDAPCDVGYDAASNISVDILKMLPSCSLSVSHPCR